MTIHRHAKTWAHTRTHTHACAHPRTQMHAHVERMMGFANFSASLAVLPHLSLPAQLIFFVPHVKLDWSQFSKLMCHKLPLKCKIFTCLVSCSINPLPSFSFPHSLSSFTSRWKNAACCVFIRSASILVASIAALRCLAALRTKVCTCLSLGVLLERIYFLPVLSQSQLRFAQYRLQCKNCTLL